MKGFGLKTLWAKMSFAIFILVVFMMSMVTYLFTISQLQNQRQELRQNMHRIGRQIATIRLAAITTRLKSGMNWILLKSTSRLGQHGFYFRITDEQGTGVSDIYFNRLPKLFYQRTGQGTL
jgi:sensor histidine kinase regulating citrate/malate metabolism